MFRHWTFLLLSVAAFTPALILAEDAKPDPWEKTISQYEEQDKKSPPPKDAVVFVGSSTIRLWNLKESFPDLATINRGFGGSQYGDITRFVKRIITAYQPRAIVLYSGDNDLTSKSPEKAAADFGEVIKAIRADLPETPIYVLAVKPSISRWKIVEKGREANRLIEEQCKSGKNMTFLPVEKLMLGADGEPRAELYQKDGLHMSPAGYKLWNELLLPKIETK